MKQRPTASVAAKARARSSHGFRFSGPAIIGGLTVAAVLAILAIANLMPRGGGSPPAGQSDSAGHDVPATTSGADIHFSLSEVDLGTIPLNKEVGYAFSYANIGNQTLRIDDVQVRVLEGCWPFQPITGAVMLPPGEKSEISFRTHMGQGMEGPHLFEIVVKSNDREEPESVLRVRANFH